MEMPDVPQCGPLHLRQQIATSLDRSGHQLREEGKIGGKGRQIVRRRRQPAINRHRVTDGLKRVKGDPHGQDDVLECPTRPPAQRAEQLRCGLGEEIKILEKDEHAEIRADAEEQKSEPLPRCRHAPDDLVKQSEQGWEYCGHVDHPDPQCGIGEHALPEQQPASRQTAKQKNLPRLLRPARHAKAAKEIDDRRSGDERQKPAVPATVEHAACHEQQPETPAPRQRPI